MYEKRTKIALKKWTLLGSQKIVGVDDYLLGSVGIPETHPFLFCLMHLSTNEMKLTMSAFALPSCVVLK